MATSTSNFDFSGFSVDLFYFWNLKIKTFAKFLVPLYKNSIFFSQYKWQQSKNKQKKTTKNSCVTVNVSFSVAVLRKPFLKWYWL